MQHSPVTQVRWHLVMTKPAGEGCAMMNLLRQGYGVYFPQLEQKVLRRGKWSVRTTALFPRYLFIRLDSVSQSLAPVRSTIGVANVVRFGLDYMVVPDGVIETLRRNADPRTGLHALRALDWLKHGDMVRIAGGSLAGLEGIFVSEDGNQRVTVLLSLLGRETRIQIDVGYVARSAA